MVDRRQVLTFTAKAFFRVPNPVPSIHAHGVLSLENAKAIRYYHNRKLPAILLGQAAFQSDYCHRYFGRATEWKVCSRKGAWEVVNEKGCRRYLEAAGPAQGARQPQLERSVDYLPGFNLRTLLLMPRRIQRISRTTEHSY
jgi:hypothetical protein